jgi:hypothetical protein
MSSDALVVRLDEMLTELAEAVADDTATSDAARIDRIGRLEKLRAVTAALQAAESVRFAQSQVAEQFAADVHPEVMGVASPNRSVWPADSPPWSQPGD